MPDTHEHQFQTLESGLRLVTISMKGTKTATVMVMVGTGSKYETKDINGVSHFLEHMMFKGTTKRPGKLQISKELDRIGAEYNAFTGKEYTGYYARAVSSKIDTVIDVIFDIFLNSNIDAKEVEMEKGVIIEEINMYHDDPQRHISEIFEHLMYGDQPAGWDIAGDKETVSSLTRDKIVNYFSSHYIASNTVVAVSGDIDPVTIKSKVEEYFSNIRKADKVSKLPVTEVQAEPMAVTSFRETDQSHFVLGFRSYNMFDEKKYAQAILASVLGGSMSSRLFQEVRDKRGLAYYIDAGTNSETDSGYMAVSAGVNNAKALDALEVTMAEIAKIKKEGVTTEELQEAKDHVEGRMVMALENSRVVANNYANSVLFENKVLTPEEELAKIKAVTAEDVLAVAQEIFQANKANFAIIGPFKDAEPFRKLLNI
ncbi:MAG: pitrilysin family protein [Patescibacteria group bacterium]